MNLLLLSYLQFAQIFDRIQQAEKYHVSFYAKVLTLKIPLRI